MSNTLWWVVLPVLLGTVAMAAGNIVKRQVMMGGVISPLQFLILYYTAATMVFGTVYVVVWGLTMPEVLPGLWTAVFCGGVANTLIQYFNVKAASIDKGEVSFTAPLQAMTPGLITLLAVLLGEWPSKVGGAGIGLMAIGSYVLLYEKDPQHWYEYFGPLRRIVLLAKLGHLSEAERNKTIVVFLALGSACVGTIGLLFDGLYARRSLSMQGLVLASMGLVGFLLLVYTMWYIVWPDRKHTQWFYRHLTRTALIPVLVMGVLWVIQAVMIQQTYNQAFVAYVGTLKRFSILLTVVFGYLFFKEEDFKKRFWAALLIVVGAVLVATDDLPTKLATRMVGLGL